MESSSSKSQIPVQDSSVDSTVDTEDNVNVKRGNLAIKRTLSGNIKQESEVKLEEKVIKPKPEILEGKPESGKIINVISESDIELNITTPTKKTEMVSIRSKGITLNISSKSARQIHSITNSQKKKTKYCESATDSDEDFSPLPTPDPRFVNRPLVKKGNELSSLCSII